MKKERDLVLVMGFALIVIGILSIVLWALAKSFGWIETPVWIDMIPVFSGAVVLAGISVGVGKVLQKIERVVIDVESMGKRMDDFFQRLITLETEFKSFKPKN